MWTEALRSVDKNKKTVIATVVEGQHPGYRCIVTGSECICETGQRDESLKREAMQTEQTGLRENGEEKVFFEVLGAGARLIVCGGGYVGIAVAKLAKFLGLFVTVIEDRPMLADQARIAGADEVICDTFERALKQIDGGADTFFVIVTRGHRYDRICLEAILKKTYGYVGMMGSHSRVKLLKESLRAEGCPRERLAKLHAPIGLSIHSETPEEIAVSILGEIIQIKNNGRNTAGYPEEILRGLEAPGRKVLAVIIRRRGSAPRRVGTKMVILENGSTVGTIGGGCAESEVIRSALSLLREESTVPRTIRIDMTDREAGEEGMVCGGIQDIFLEPVPDYCIQGVR